jgi:methionine synthase I (cobalamin-dependent)
MRINPHNAMELLEELQTRIICGDGAIGTLLLDRGVAVDRCLEEPQLAG